MFQCKNYVNEDLPQMPSAIRTICLQILKNSIIVDFRVSSRYKKLPQMAEALLKCATPYGCRVVLRVIMNKAQNPQHA